jgi:hypothetical protein
MIGGGGSANMNRTLTATLALAAGMLGGLLSHYITPATVLAQTQTQKEIKAQSFVLVDEKNNVVGTFKPLDNPIAGAPTVVLLDRNGRELWRAGVSVKVLSER